MKTTKLLKLSVAPGIGEVSAEYIIPESPVAIMTLAHGAGAGMDHEFMVNLANALAETGVATLRFNFPFKENGKGRPDSPAVAHATIAAAIAHAGKEFDSLPLLAAGKSFGGRMSSQYLAANPRPEVKGIVFYGFPLHQPGKPATERAAHLKELLAPKLFLQGTKDELANWDLVYSVCASLRKTRLVKIMGANHGFRAGKTDVVAILVRSTKNWIDEKITG